MNLTSDAKAGAVGSLALVEAQSTRLQDFLALTKARLTMLVLFAAAVGFFLAAGSQPDYTLLAHMLFGTALVAAGSSALNQVLERNNDKLMARTRNRPLPAGRMTPANALNLGASLAIGGMLYLALTVNVYTAMLAALTLGLYVFAYTPLKRVTTLNTLVGAVPGALPPLIGWTAAGGTIDARAWTLFAIMLLWQLPHFLAIAWIYREDYAAAGFKMLPVVDPDGASAGRQIILHTLTLLPVSLLPFFMHLTGELYFAAAVVLGLAFLGFGIHFAWKRTDRAARQLFLASVAYLSVLLALMIFDRQ